MNKTILNKIRHDGFKVKKPTKIIEYINKYGYYRIINCYGNYLKNNYKKCNTNDIIKIFEFDKKLANILAGYLFDFEQQLNAIAINVIIEQNNLNDDYVLNITNNPAYSNLRNKGFADFNNEIYDNAKSCNLINDNIDPRTLPLKVLSVCWSFHTLISFIYLQNDDIICHIAKKFNLDASAEEFISMCHSIRKFRNILSHNGFFFKSQLNFYRREFNNVLNKNLSTNYNIDTNITIYKLIIVLEKVLDKNIRTDLLKLIKKTKLISHQKNIILNDIGF